MTEESQVTHGYSIIGDPTQGVHNLRIVNAKNDDNGEFQCQVRSSHVRSGQFHSFTFHLSIYSFLSLNLLLLFYILILHYINSSFFRFDSPEAFSFSSLSLSLSLISSLSLSLSLSLQTGLMTSKRKLLDYRAKE